MAQFDQYEDYKYLFNRSLKEMSPSFNFNDKDPLDLSFLRLWDDAYDVGYKHNSYGYRCNEFGNQKIMFLGCSNTYGMGLKLEHTWPHILSKKLNADYINLARGGDSAQAQVVKAFEFFKEFHNPEVIFAMFPIFRIESPKVKKVLEKNKVNNEGQYEILQHFFNNEKADIFKYAKAPYNLDNILPREFSIFYTFIFIHILIQYCESNKIKLIWMLNDMGNLEKAKEILNLKHPDNFVNLDFFSREYLNNHDCHLEFKDEIDFDVAADNGHLGLHYHLHIAEKLYSLMV